MKKLYPTLCIVTLLCPLLSGCGNKGTSSTMSAQDMKNFKGGPPPPDVQKKMAAYMQQQQALAAAKMQAQKK